MTPALHPDLAAAFAGVPAAPPLDDRGLAAARAARAATLGSGARPPGVERTEMAVGSARAVVHRPLGGEPAVRGAARRGVLWVHGGGYVLGPSGADDDRAERWAAQLGVVVVQPRYRLAPEHPYPAALEDCLAVLAWARAHADELGLDPDAIGVGGSSAGGGLAAAVALAVRDRRLPPLTFQALLAPMLDDRRRHPSNHWDVPVWPPASNAYGWRSYLGGLEGDEVPAHAAPARAVDLAGLPPTLVVVGGADGFLDEDVDYALRLAHAGVSVDLRVHAGLPHGIGLVAPSSSVVRRALDGFDAWIADALAS